MNDGFRIDDRELISATRYAESGYPYSVWKQLRDHAPLYWVETLEHRPFWAVTRHADITAVSRDPRRFLNAPRLTVGSSQGADLPVRMLLNMDPPEHHAYRSVLNKRLTPRALSGLSDQVDAIATTILDSITEGGESGMVDFVEDVSARLPIWVIAEMLGIPRSDWKMLLDWTNRTVGAGDEEYQAGGASGVSTMNDAADEMFAYFEQLTDERRTHPTGDLLSALTHASIDGSAIPRYELLSYIFLLVVAGNETTRNATTGGLLALIENPAALERVRRDPGLLDSLVEEILRWTSPVVHFCRTASEDVEWNGQKIRAGDSLCLFYPSANRDERAFDDPDTFQIDRRPNRHIAFGVGEHFCLGAHVARLELRVFFRRLIDRLESVELVGEPVRLRSSVIGGIKHLPVRFRLSA